MFERRLQVAAPSERQCPVRDQVRTDERDARHLARLLHLVAVAVAVPSVEQEAARDLVGVREDVRGDLMSARHRLSKLLLRRESSPTQARSSLHRAALPVPGPRCGWRGRTSSGAQRVALRWPCVHPRVCSLDGRVLGARRGVAEGGGKARRLSLSGDQVGEGMRRDDRELIHLCPSCRCTRLDGRVVICGWVTARGATLRVMRWTRNGRCRGAESGSRRGQQVAAIASSPGALTSLPPMATLPALVPHIPDAMSDIDTRSGATEDLGISRG